MTPLFQASSGTTVRCAFCTLLCFRDIPVFKNHILVVDTDCDVRGAEKHMEPHMTSSQVAGSLPCQLWRALICSQAIVGIRERQLCQS